MCVSRAKTMVCALGLSMASIAKLRSRFKDVWVGKADQREQSVLFDGYTCCVWYLREEDDLIHHPRCSYFAAGPCQIPRAENDAASWSHAYACTRI